MSVRRVPYREAYNIVNEHSGFSMKYGSNFSKEIKEWLCNWFEDFEEVIVTHVPSGYSLPEE